MYWHCCCLCSTLCNPMNHSTPGFPVFHYLQSLLKFMSVESVMPSNHLTLYHSLQSSPASEALPIRWSKYWSFSISPCSEIFRVDLLSDWQVWSPCSPRDSEESSPALQFESINSLVLNLPYGASHIHTWLLEKPWLWLYGFLSAMSVFYF